MYSNLTWRDFHFLSTVGSTKAWCHMALRVKSFQPLHRDGPSRTRTVVRNMSSRFAMAWPSTMGLCGTAPLPSSTLTMSLLALFVRQVCYIHTSCLSFSYAFLLLVPPFLSRFCFVISTTLYLHYLIPTRLAWLVWSHGSDWYLGLQRRWSICHHDKG